MFKYLSSPISFIWYDRYLESTSHFFYKPMQGHVYLWRFISLHLTDEVLNAVWYKLSFHDMSIDETKLCTMRSLWIVFAFAYITIISLPSTRGTVHFISIRFIYNMYTLVNAINMHWEDRWKSSYLYVGSCLQ